LVPFVTGQELPGSVKSITQDRINKYATVSGDYNPIHVDEKFAASTPLGGTIAHGMLIMADIADIMANAFGLDWINGGKLSVRFKSPARPGDTVTTTGKITGIEPLENISIVNCEVQCANQKGEILIAGEAQVKINKIQ
jgi:3-hydroxybutyryl-CoA dehydratase